LNVSLEVLGTSWYFAWVAASTSSMDLLRREGGAALSTVVVNVPSRRVASSNELRPTGGLRNTLVEVFSRFVGIGNCGSAL
tara:strand:- start:264 stop:506 length:243 start_codon:yes stop_codon:yes gene_type:complete